MDVVDGVDATDDLICHGLRTHLGECRQGGSQQLRVVALVAAVDQLADLTWVDLLGLQMELGVTQEVATHATADLGDEDVGPSDLQLLGAFIILESLQHPLGAEIPNKWQRCHISSLRISDRRLMSLAKNQV